MCWCWFGGGRRWRRWVIRKYRNIWFDHKSRFFKPSGVKTSELEEVVLQKDEMECLRLKNVKWLDIISWAEEMNISKSTFARIYNNAVIKISDALVNGKIVRIED